MKPTIFCLIITFACLCGYGQRIYGKVLLAVFAHPDDEQTVAPVLAKYAAQGVDVYLVVATDGRLGVTNHAKIPAGDSLAHVRKGEITCACQVLGIHAPILLGLHDQLDAQPNNAFGAALDSARKGILKTIYRLKPDVILTWGPVRLDGRSRSPAYRRYCYRII